MVNEPGSAAGGDPRPGYRQSSFDDLIRQADMTHSREFNRSLAIRWFEEVWNDGRAETIDELTNPGAVGHLEGQGAVDIEQIKAFRAAMLSSFSDLRVHVEDTAADGDNVVVRWRFSGTHDGDGLGFPASGSVVDVPGMTWLVFRNGKIDQGWDAWNQGEFVQNLREPG